MSVRLAAVKPGTRLMSQLAVTVTGITARGLLVGVLHPPLKVSEMQERALWGALVRGSMDCRVEALFQNESQCSKMT